MNSLLPPGSTPLERRLAQTCSGISDLQVPLRDLWNPATCPVSFLPYLAWAFSVDRWDEGWTESVKRQVVKDAFYIHQHKGTTSAVRRVVEPFGFLIRIIEWWQTGEAPGTFRGTVAKLAMRQPFVLFKGLTFQKLCLPGAFRPGDHHNKMLRPGLCVVHASPQYL